MENNTLVIERVKKDDEGLYECRASNDLGQDSTSAFTRIQGEPGLRACRVPLGSLRELGHFSDLAVHSPAGSEEKSNIEVIILVCTGLAATLFWLLLTLFIRKLRKVRELPSCTRQLQS